MLSRIDEQGDLCFSRLLLFREMPLANCAVLPKLYKEKNPDEGLYHFVRGRDNDVVNITSSQYTEYMKAIIRELVANYDIDGIHFDYIRLSLIHI